MKLTLKVIALFFCVALMAACGKNNDLLKTWKLKDMVSDGKTMEQQMNEQIARMDTDTTMNDTMKAEMKKMMETQMATFRQNPGTITFNADGTYSLKMGEETESGKWVLSEDKKTLTTTNDKGKEQKLTIESLSESALTLAINRDNSSAKYVFEASTGATGTEGTSSGSGNAGH